MGIRSLLVAAGVPTIDLTILGIAFAVVIWFFRSYLTDAETFALLVLGGLLTLNAHTYTLVGLIISVPVLCTHADEKRWVAAAGICLGVLLFFPRRVLRELVQPDLLPEILTKSYLHWRVPVVLGIALLIVIAVAVRERGQRRYADPFN